jgi:hypothetical protein
MRRPGPGARSGGGSCAARDSRQRCSGRLRGVARHALGRPLDRSRQQGLLHRVLAGVEAAVAPYQSAEDLRRQLPQQVLDLGGCAHLSSPPWSRTGRTSRWAAEPTSQTVGLLWSRIGDVTGASRGPPGILSHELQLDPLTWRFGAGRQLFPPRQGHGSQRPGSPRSARTGPRGWLPGPFGRLTRTPEPPPKRRDSGHLDDPGL